MSVFVFEQVPLAVRFASGDAARPQSLTEIRYEGEYGSDYGKAARNEGSMALPVIRAGEHFESQKGDHARVLVAMYDAELAAVVDIPVDTVNAGVTEQAVQTPVTKTAEQIAEDEYYAKLESYGSYSGGVDSAQTAAANEAANANAPNAGAAPANTATEETYYAPPADTAYYAPDEPVYYAPSPSSGGGGSTGSTGDAAGYSGPENNYERGPDITSEGNENYWQ